MTLLNEQEVNWGDVAGTIKELAGGGGGPIMFIISKFSKIHCDSLQYHHLIFKIQRH